MSGMHKLDLFQLKLNISVVNTLLIHHRIIFVFPMGSVVLLTLAVNYSLTYLLTFLLYCFDINWSGFVKCYSCLSSIYSSLR